MLLIHNESVINGHFIFWNASVDINTWDPLEELLKHVTVSTDLELGLRFLLLP